jgi:hypothetical protein
MGWGEGCIEDVLQMQLSILYSCRQHSSQRPLLWEEIFLVTYL